MNNVYLLSLSYASTPSHQDAVQVNPSISTTFANLTTPAPALQVRVGYMGFCMPDSTGDWICSRHAKSLAKTINNTHTSSSGDPLNLLWIANNFQSQIVFDGLMSDSPSHPTAPNETLADHVICQILNRPSRLHFYSSPLHLPTLARRRGRRRE